MVKYKTDSSVISKIINYNPDLATKEISKFAVSLIKNSDINVESIRAKTKMSSSSFYYGLKEDKFYNFNNAIKIIKAFDLEFCIKIK